MKLRAVIILVVIAAVLFLIIGFILVLFGTFDKDLYTNLAAIVGGIASILGLLGFLIPSVSKSDVENVGIEYLKSVVEAADELKLKETELLKKEKQLSTKEKEIQELEIKKQEMEVLVRKASLRLFLQDQVERNQSRIGNIVDRNDELKELLNERLPLIQKLEAIQGDIESDPNVKVLEEIMISINPKYKRDVEGSIEIDLFPSIGLFPFGRTISELIKILLK